MSYEQKMGDADSTLWRAVVCGDLSSAKAALDAGANPNLVHVVWEEYSDHLTPVLYQACRLRNRDIVALLLEHGADPNAEYHERHKYEGMLWAPSLEAAKPDSEITQLLLSKGADPDRGVRRRHGPYSQ